MFAIKVTVLIVKKEVTEGPEYELKPYIKGISKKRVTL